MSFLSCQNWKGIAKSQKRFKKNYHRDVLTRRSWRNCNKQAKGLMAQSSVTLYAENWLRDYENMQSESVMAVSELFDLKSKARKKLNKWKQLIDKFFVQSWNGELQKP
jgi:hypothetical protein